MTSSINNEFDWEGIQVKISLPSSYDPNQTYPAILLNDGNLDFPIVPIRICDFSRLDL